MSGVSDAEKVISERLVSLMLLFPDVENFCFHTLFIFNPKGWCSPESSSNVITAYFQGHKWTS